MIMLIQISILKKRDFDPIKTKNRLTEYISITRHFIQFFFVRVDKIDRLFTK